MKRDEGATNWAALDESGTSRRNTFGTAGATGVDVDTVAWGPDGLVPAVVQDAADGVVLMLAWMDRDALAATLATGLVYFHSRSRGRLWQKGESSGNVLHLRALALDCDGDAILVTADPAGPTCHAGTRSCFDGAQAQLAASRPPATLGDTPGAWRVPVEGTPQGFAWLERLWETIDHRRSAADPDRSYTARLLSGGVASCGRKVTEEATEVLLAARDDAEAERGGLAAVAARAQARKALASEVADLLYHLLVLCAERRLEPAAALEVLRERRRA
jgi:phosphoribosyl-ATP pyrophosphohydrolase/phosphoribosyl-AMP cyclohydrolase